MEDPALVIKDLRFSHTAEGGAPFTLSLDAFQLDRGEQALMVGTSGSGKSTHAAAKSTAASTLPETTVTTLAMKSRLRRRKRPPVDSGFMG